MTRPRAIAVLVAILAPVMPVQAEILVRWSQDAIPSPAALGLSTVAIPANSPAAVRSAVAQGYRVYIEVDAGSLATLVTPPAGLAGIVIRGSAAPEVIAKLERRMEGLGARLFVLDERGRWPHIRSNWVTRNNEVLQVAGRSAQPWIDTNAALFRILHATDSQGSRAVSYRWAPATIATLAQPPRVENYLVAIAEAGTFGGTLLLALDDDFQANLLLGTPSARTEWTRIRQHLEFYAWVAPARYRVVANIGVVTMDPMPSFEILNLLARHNLSFELVEPSRVPTAASSLDLLLVLDQPSGAASAMLVDFARQGGTVVVAAGDQSRAAQAVAPWRASRPVEMSEGRIAYEAGAGRVIEVRPPIVDPDAFAFELRQILGRDRRVLDIWNGITVLATPYASADGETVLVAALNYAHQPLPVQLRVRGTFSVVHHESPDEPLSLLSHTHRDGFTEFVLPSLRTGARVFLTGRTP